MRVTLLLIDAVADAGRDAPGRPRSRHSTARHPLRSGR
ncbi:hypothetical protein GGR44_002192 [Sphingobium fontiphilum]|uniref:Uncharacterized protein n=1 Tax=Sphingobium fontiphilum TaxID=944425 RepID=A0A7W6DP42_9SPHN|nr:hypothetical protein [Sphingobium fontiphilum]